MIGMRAEDGTTDMLLIGLWNGAEEQALWRWKEATPDLHPFMPDYHRLQVEFWIYQHWQQGNLAGRVMDVGVYDRRAWIGDGYFTFGEKDADVIGDLTLLYPSDVGGELDAIICTEVLEHCKDPMQACRHLYDCLKPGGLLLVTSPFLWPDHATEDYNDYWRFTVGGWRLLLQQFADIKIIQCAWTGEGAAAYDLMRRWEGMGWKDTTRGATGYLVSARRGR